MAGGNSKGLLPFFRQDQDLMDIPGFSAAVVVPAGDRGDSAPGCPPRRTGPVRIPVKTSVFQIHGGVAGTIFSSCFCFALAAGRQIFPNGIEFLFFLPAENPLSISLQPLLFSSFPLLHPHLTEHGTPLGKARTPFFLHPAVSFPQGGRRRKLKQEHHRYDCQSKEDQITADQPESIVEQRSQGTPCETAAPVKSGAQSKRLSDTELQLKRILTDRMQMQVVAGSNDQEDQKA